MAALPLHTHLCFSANPVPVSIMWRVGVPQILCGPAFAMPSPPVRGLSSCPSVSAGNWPWGLGGRLNPAEAQKVWSLIPTLDSSVCATRAILVFPWSCRGFMGWFSGVFPQGWRWSLTVQDRGQSHVCYPGHAGTRMDNQQSAECEGQTSAIGNREHKENTKETPLPPKGWAVLSHCC